MLIISATEFKANNLKYFDLASSGERVWVESRTRGLFEIKPVKKRQSRKHKPLELTSELQAEIERAEEEFKHGECISLRTHKDIDQYFESL